MLKRLVVGLLEGLLVGVVVAVALTKIGLRWDSSALAYGASALSGAGTGLIAGKPIWGKNAKTEGLLKAVISAFIAVTCMFGIRKWLSGVTTNLTAIGAGSGRLADLPSVSLPLITMAIALVLEIDDAFGADPGASSPTRVRDRDESVGVNSERTDDTDEGRTARHER